MDIKKNIACNENDACTLLAPGSVTDIIDFSDEEGRLESLLWVGRFPKTLIMKPIEEVNVTKEVIFGEEFTKLFR